MSGCNININSQQPACDWSTSPWQQLFM